MKKLPFVLFAAFFVGAILASSPGCSSTCDTLRDICDRCTDADYRVSCEATVTEGDSAVCSGRISTYQQFCPDRGEGGAGGGVVDACLFGEVSCAGSCTDVSANAAACGSCNNACAEGQVCAASTCVTTCPDTLPTLCEATQGCVDVASDPLNCGGCGNKCDPGEICSNGTCGDACDPASPTACDGACVNLANSPLHCGGCGNACLPGQLCLNGVCAADCGESLEQCCGKCVDTASDPAHCGGCGPGCPELGGGAPPGTACADGLVCSQGSCETSCAGGLTECPGGACIDLSSDKANCGSCGNLCPGTAVCDGGVCAAGGCGAGKTDCGGQCVTLGSDADHCGACGNVCGGSTPHCSLGSCAAACAPGLESCGGDCVDQTSDPKHCGGCGVTCSGATPRCQAGSCVAACGPGFSDCGGGQCVNTQGMASNLLHCGACGNNCGDNNVCTADSCTGGQCANVSGGAICNDGNPCTQDTCDPIGGCQSDAYSQDDLVALCMALGQPSTFNPNTQCLYCNPTGDNPCAASTAAPEGTMAPIPTSACSNPPPSSVPGTCGTCVFQSGTPTCQTSLAQSCPDI